MVAVLCSGCNRFMMPSSLPGESGGTILAQMRRFYVHLTNRVPAVSVDKQPLWFETADAANQYARDHGWKVDGDMHMCMECLVGAGE